MSSLFVLPFASLAPVGAQVADTGAGDADVTLISSVTAEVPAGLATWIALSWTDVAAHAATFQVRAAASQNVEITYPTNTGDHSSLYWDDKLSVAEIDYTALRLGVPEGTTEPIELSITLSYVSPSGPQTRLFTAVVPVEGGGMPIAETVGLAEAATIYVSEANGNVECTIAGTEGGENLQGTTGDDVICGFGGNDVINGNGGNDVIYGGAGNDMLYGAGGDDFIAGESGKDTIYGYGGNDELSGADDNDSIFGGDGDDQISAGGANDRVFGDDGQDTVHGGDGNDSLFGGEGDDYLNGDAGQDKATGDAGTDTCIAKNTWLCEL